MLRPHEIEDVIHPGERIVWEGRPVGWPRPTFRRLAFAVLVAAGVTAAVLGVVGLVWAQGPFSVALQGSRVVVTATGGPHRVRANVWQHSTYLSTSAAVPVAFALTVLAALELVALASLRARRYAVTDQRVVVMGTWSVRHEALGAHAPLREAKTIVYGSLRLEGVADPEAALSALERRGGAPL